MLIAIIKPTGATNISGINKYAPTLGRTIAESTMRNAANVGRLKMTTVQKGHCG